MRLEKLSEEIGNSLRKSLSQILKKEIKVKRTMRLAEVRSLSPYFLSDEVRFVSNLISGGKGIGFFSLSRISAVKLARIRELNSSGFTNEVEEMMSEMANILWGHFLINISRYAGKTFLYTPPKKNSVPILNEFFKNEKILFSNYKLYSDIFYINTGFLLDQNLAKLIRKL